MPAPLSRDLRERIVRAVESGSSIRQAALRFEVSPSAAVKLMRRFRESGSPAPARLVFLDETGTSTNMVRRYGRCPRGERLVDATPWGHWKITTFVAGLRQRRDCPDGARWPHDR